MHSKFLEITQYKILRCRHHSHILRTLIWTRCVCWVRSLFAIVRSGEIFLFIFCAFHYQFRSFVARLPSVFVVGTPLMLNNLVPIRKFAYIFDRQHWNSHAVWHKPWVGERTQRAALWGRGATKPWGRGFFSWVSREWQVAQAHRWCRCLVCRVLASQDLWLPFWKPPFVQHWEDLAGKPSLPHGRSLFSTMLPCHYLM